MGRAKVALTLQQKRTVYLMYSYRITARDISKALDIPYHHVTKEIAFLRRIDPTGQKSPKDVLHAITVFNQSLPKNERLKI